MHYVDIRQSPSRIKKMVGYNCHTKEIIKMPFVCIRKPVKETPDMPYFCFVSNPLLIKQKHLTPFMWMHCYRNENKIPGGAPRYLYPESNFMDMVHCPVSNRDNTKQDYVYFTISGRKGNEYKGLMNYIRDVPLLHKMGLHGTVVFYNSTRGMDRKSLTIIRRSGGTIRSGRISRSEVSSLLAKSKFGFFPNVSDCSPRIIAECFMQNRPAIVNEAITGGWHYFENTGFGSLYRSGDPVSLKSAVSRVVNLPYNQRDLWYEKYGFNVGTKYLADLIKIHFPCDEINRCTHAYFRDYNRVFKEVPEMFHDN